MKANGKRNFGILTMFFVVFFVLFGSACLELRAQAQVRIKDISALSGNREYQVLGYGLVTGLTATGDKSGMSVEMVRGMLQNMGMELSAGQIGSQNVAAVIVSGMLPPYARAGEAFDVTISSIGDAKSLQGGVLLPTLMKAGDGQVYAVAQGKVSVGGFESGRGGAAGARGGQKNHLTVGYISNGAITERGVDDSFARNGKFSILLNEKDSVLTKRVKEAVDRKYSGGWAKIINPGNIEITVPQSMKDDPVSFAANIENLTLTIDEPNRVVINERTGTVIVGNNVRISRVVIAHNGIQIAVDGENQTANARGKDKKTASMAAVEGETTVDELVEALNAIGASPKDLIAIFEAINAAGALHGELKLM